MFNSFYPNRKDQFSTEEGIPDGQSNVVGKTKMADEDTPNNNKLNGDGNYNTIYDNTTNQSPSLLHNKSELSPIENMVGDSNGYALLEVRSQEL